MSVPVYGRRFDSGAVAFAAYALAVDRWIVRSGRDVSFVRGQYPAGVWHVWTLGEHADPEMVVGGVPVPVPAEVAAALRQRRAANIGDTIGHHNPPLILPL